MKAWIVCDKEVCQPVRAYTRGEARFQANDLADDEWALTLSVRRMPEFDAREWSDYELLSLGYYHWSECWGCYRRLQSPRDRGGIPVDYDGISGFNVGGRIYCARCFAKERERISA